ncbi:SigE family RNA polymerase sigma factor [Actinoplanes flavus]|uniref:SigE family RNA polymerase sigma factor n=1 Tax=Actinoplanes flavus TaxID=2820290 RepID=A0ABS3UDM1_9ACTN|nr:SigE family RNA polymerase sigma factor [Actinoplanes flavus]MBO3736541.1 SigE family RNA polymerase sigma factor [Actinoplanes flavus]
MKDDFAAFVEHSGPRLLRFGVLLCGSVSDAEDLLHDSLVSSFPRWRKLRDQQPEAYVRRAMLNRLLSRQRSPWVRRRQTEVPDAAATRDEMSRADNRNMLLDALRELPPRMRAVIVLRYWLGYSEQETATTLDCSVGSVKSQSSRGLQRLRELVKDCVASGAEGQKR